MTRNALNVCMYTPSADGGHALYTQELLTALAEVGPSRGIAAELVTAEDLAEVNQASCYPIHMILPRLVPRREFSSPLSWVTSRLAYYSRRERTFLDWVATRRDLDLIHFQEYTPWLAPRHYRKLRRRGLALVFTVHNVLAHYCHNSIHRLMRDSTLRSAWRECDALLVHSDGLRDALSDFLGPGHPPIHVTAHGVWRCHGRAATDSVEDAVERPRLLFFGVIRPNKGLHVLLEALERLPHCDVTVAGAGDEPNYNDRIRTLVNRFAPGRVEWIDRYIAESEIPALFEKCQLVVLPYTFFNSQSGVLLQALAYQRPVVASDLGAMGECVKQWQIGPVVSPGDAVALAHGIEQALEPESYRQSVQAIARVRSELTWSRMADATIDVYQSIVA